MTKRNSSRKFFMKAKPNIPVIVKLVDNVVFTKYVDCFGKHHWLSNNKILIRFVFTGIVEGPRMIVDKFYKKWKNGCWIMYNRSVGLGNNLSEAVETFRRLK